MEGRTVGPLFVLTLLLATAFAVPVMADVGDEVEFTIVCANSILADFAENVVGDLAQVEYLMPAGVCPSHFDSRPSDATMVAGADVIIMMGWEGWLNGLIEATGKSEVPRINCMGLGDQNLPEDAKRFVDKIATEMAVIMPEHADAFAANAAPYKTSIEAKAVELRERVQAAGVTGRKVVVMEWQKAFVEFLDFEVVNTYSSPEGLSVKDQLNVTEAASAEDVVMIVDNLQSTTEFGTQVAAETGKSHVILTNYPSAYPNTYTYLDMIDYNTDQLIEGVEEYEYKRGEIADLEAQVKDLETERGMYLTMAVILLIVTVFLGLLLVRSRSRGD
jgi:ABC-type Zn uptake system ZnuABC Zn-binding protein ZnuA